MLLTTLLHQPRGKVSPISTPSHSPHRVNNSLQHASKSSTQWTIHFPCFSLLNYQIKTYVDFPRDWRQLPPTNTTIGRGKTAEAVNKIKPKESKMKSSFIPPEVLEERYHLDHPEPADQMDFYWGGKPINWDSWKRENDIWDSKQNKAGEAEGQGTLTLPRDRQPHAQGDGRYFGKGGMFL